ncbi:MAG TPA: alginate lyase, partial [Glaciecola sp.]|nr:alginate lyase [Glaciecola sp.]
MQKKWLVYMSVFTCMGLNSMLVNAKEYLVADPQAYQDIADSLKAGDIVTLADGTWTDFQIAFSGQGTEDSPITLQAETAGKVILTGESNLRLAGEYLLVSGLFFKDGHSPSNAVIEFRHSKTQLASHSRVTQTVVESFNNPEKFSAGNWVALYGRYNRFDHNALVGKSTSGVTMAVKLNTVESQENHHRIDHNYFGQRPILGSNGGETLRIGTSHYSLSNSYTMIESNYFDRCNGEVEIISNKSGSNTIQNNVFFESRGTLTLRHGNGNIVQNNIFFGNGKDHTGGIRVINGDQTIRNNYLEGVTGYRFGSGLTVMNGVPNSKINRYHQVDNANITQNSLINLDHIHFAAGSDAERSAAPINSRFTNNLIVHQESKDGISLFDDVSGIEFAGNIVHNASELTIDKGFAVDNVELARAKNGLLYPTNPEFAKTGVDKALQPTAKTDTGPSWYNKPELSVEFGIGTVHKITPSTNVLYKTLQQAQSGDVIELGKGHYVASRTLPVDKVITFTGKAGVSISFERKSLFVIEDGGSLALKNIVITGADAPDSAGNSLIRNTRLPTINNYRLVMDNVVVKDLDI